MQLSADQFSQLRAITRSRVGRHPEGAVVLWGIFREMRGIADANKRATHGRGHSPSSPQARALARRLDEIDHEMTTILLLGSARLYTRPLLERWLLGRPEGQHFYAFAAGLEDAAEGRT